LEELKGEFTLEVLELGVKETAEQSYGEETGGETVA
jgi:hypothetical protein